MLVIDVKFLALTQKRPSNENLSIPLILGDPSPKVLAPIYEEFRRWYELLQPEFQSYLLKTQSQAT